jgi:predicted SprT family Zn-dependent metalloprotease
MNKDYAIKLTKKHLIKNCLYEWEVKLNNTRSCNGSCNYNKKTIFLSNFLVDTATDEDILDTILHEIAHAIDFKTRGKSNHDWKWKKIAKQLGANPKRCANKMVGVKLKYNFCCPNCENNFQTGKYIRLKYRTCANCKTPLNEFIIEKRW